MNDKDIELLAKLNRDIKQTARLITHSEVRFMVERYYQIQKARIIFGNQVDKSDRGQDEGAVSILRHFCSQFMTLENQMKAVLDKYSMSTPVGQWCRSNVGVGPVIAAGLLGSFDIKKAPVVGHFWSYAGLNPNMIWLGSVKAKAEVKKAMAETNDDLDEALIKVANVIGIRPENLRDLATRDETTKTGEEMKRKKLTKASLTSAAAKRPWNDKLKVLCVLPECRVTTLRGVIPIKEVVVGDLVLTHKGRFRRVTKVFVNDHDGIVYGLRSANAGNQVAWLTEGHPVYAAKCQTYERNNGRTISVKEGTQEDYSWHPVEEIQPRWKLLRPVTKKCDNACADKITLEGVPSDQGFVKGEGRYKGAAHPRANRVKEVIYMNSDFMRFIGLFISEGHICNNKIYFSFHAQELALIGFIKRMFREYSPDAKIIENLSEENNSTQIGICCKPLANRIEELFGKDYITVRFPMDWLLLPDHLLQSLFDGIMEGEGDHTGRLKGRRISTGNQSLAHQILALARRLGYSASLHSEGNKKAFRILINERPDINPGARSTLAKEYQGKVYNLEVEEDHTYIVEGYAVHNCWKLGQSFMKQSGNERCFYGHKYLERKQFEIDRNESGYNKAYAEKRLENTPKTWESYKHFEKGKIPPIQIQLRATRWAVKLFLAHLHDVMYRDHFKKEPPLPYAIEHLGHSHVIEVPNQPEDL